MFFVEVSREEVFLFIVKDSFGTTGGTKNRLSVEVQFSLEDTMSNYFRNAGNSPHCDTVQNPHSIMTANSKHPFQHFLPN